MSSMLGSLRRVITGYPWVTVLVLFLITIALGAGSAQRAEPPDTEATLPAGSDVALALAEIDDLFGDSGEAIVVTLLFRGEVLTPAGLSQMDQLITKLVIDPDINPLLTPTNSVLAPSLLLEAALGTDGFESVTQEQIDSARGVPGIGEALDLLSGIDAEGASLTVGTLRLQDTGDERIEIAERKARQLALDDEGPLQVSTVSPVAIEDDFKRATEEGIAPLVGVAFLLIAALILLFMRTISDMLLTLAGLLVSIIWITGAEGWLGPNGLGLVGPPNQLSVMVPIIIIGLTVDYAIQIVSHYREQRNSGAEVLTAVRTGLRHVTTPLTLAAITTIVSLLVGLFSPIDMVNDFGIVGGLGVGLSLIVMLTLIPAGRTIIDRRREARGVLAAPRPISAALPGVARMAESLGRGVTRRPTPYIVGVVAVTVALGFAATDLDSEFNISSALPAGDGLKEDMEALDYAFGGSEEMFTVLVRAESTETRTILNLRDLTDAFADPSLRPPGAAGPIQASYELVVRDWITDSGQPGDKYDPELATLFRQASAGVRLDAGLMQDVLDRIEAQDPAMKHLLFNDPNGPDAILFQFPAYGGQTEQTAMLQRDLEDLWQGDGDHLTAISSSIISFAVSNAITEQQTEAISTTLTVALTVLALFFWVTFRQPALAVIAVGPIMLVLISVLGTMALLDIPYTIITSIIAALSIGIGVDYTIHMIHRYREEYATARDPERAAIRTLSTTGSALLGSALTTALGLGVLVFSPVQGFTEFAITAAITIAYSLIVSILLVPPAMTVWGSYQNVRLRSKMERWADELDEVIEATHRKYE